MNYRVVYVNGADHVWHAGNLSLDEAAAVVRSYKRQGRTAWVVTPAGKHVPIKGAIRIPSTAGYKKIID